jgi:histidinol-phosphate aminotransferase
VNTPSPRPREEIATIPAYVPGKQPDARAGVVVRKASSNENPYPPLPAILDAVAGAAASLNRYPDMACTALHAVLGERLGVDPQRLVSGAGSVGVLYHLLQAFCVPGDEVVHAWRSFEAYPIAITVAGATSVPVPLTVDGRHDLDAMLTAVTPRTRVVLLCTPNNPTGPALTQRELAGFIDAVPGDVLVVVDEAYREFVRTEDPSDAVALQEGRPNVVALRTFAKAFGLAGLRVGHLVGSVEVAAAARACALPFGVSSIAQAAALAALSAEDEIAARVALIVGQRDRAVAELRDQGWTLPDAQGNFVWFPVGPATAAFVARAEAEGLLVRPFADEGVRVTVGDPEADEVLLRVAAAALRQP